MHIVTNTTWRIMTLKTKIKSFIKSTYVVICAIWYHLFNLKNVKCTHGGVLLLVKLQAEACNYTKSNTPPWVFFTFFKLYEWYQIAQRTTYKCQSNKESNVRLEGRFSKICRWIMHQSCLLSKTLF